MKIAGLFALLLIAAFSSSPVAAFASVPGRPSLQLPRSQAAATSPVSFLASKRDHDKSGKELDVDEAIEASGRFRRMKNFETIASAAVTVWIATAQSAVADSPDWGIFEGRTGSLLHPITMGSLLLFSIYTGLLGFQWRRLRTIGDEISALKKSLPSLDGAKSVADALKEAKGAETIDQNRVSALEAAVPVEQQLADLQKERKELAEAGPRDRHYSQGALLAFIGTAFAIEVRGLEPQRCAQSFSYLPSPSGD